MRSLRPLSPSSEKKIEDLLLRMQQYYRYHGINLRTCYEDFDKHHVGIVTESQVSFHNLLINPLSTLNACLSSILYLYIPPWEH